VFFNPITALLNLISWALHSIISLFILAFVLWCAWDCFNRRFREDWHKWAWLAAILLIWPLGALAYAIFGREQGRRY
jgi:hypothetical protein